MGDLGRIHQLIIPIGDYKMIFNLEAIAYAAAAT